MRCISVCQRGYGHSSYNTKITSLSDFAEDMSLFIKEHLKLKSAYFLGHSNGGVTGIYLANKIPEVIKGVI